MTSKGSLRYGGGALDARSALMKLFGLIQRKKVIILNSDPELCGEILSASDTKGSFLEQLIATPAWHPIYSIESMDGERWQNLANDFKKVLNRLQWRARLNPLIQKQMKVLKASVEESESKCIDAETLSRTVVRILYELLFEHSISKTDETLFYRAAEEWKKEIAVKGLADPGIKTEFWSQLQERVAASRFKEGLETYEQDPAAWLSVFAQPFLISPQINIGDIFVSIFHFLRADPLLLKQACEWARLKDRPLLEGIVLEAIRLKHPFPILERELKADFESGDHRFFRGTQVFILLDQFKQDQKFQPERWLMPTAQNPYAALPFASGPRMCIGKPIALELLCELLASFLTDFSLEQLRPEFGHRFSGRNNDQSATLGETWYQIRVFARALGRSFRLRSAPKPSQCPWSRLFHSK